MSSFSVQLGQTILSFKKNIDWKLGAEVAEDFLNKTSGLYKRAEIAGSLRRKEPIVHDIDIAVIPSIDSFSEWERAFRNRVAALGCTVLSMGDAICNFRFRDVQVNLFVCRDERYWGVLYMWATGPRGHTIGMNIKAEKKGFRMSPKGLFTRDKEIFIPTPTEEDIARVLDWKYKPPELRGKTTAGKNSFELP